MKHVITILLITHFFVGVGCKEKRTDENRHIGQTVVDLNETKRWLANTETTHGIQAMIVLTDAYLANPTSELNPLKENLIKELSGVFQKCTMKGESHDQLHNYLLPLKEKLETLSGSDDVQAVEDINLYLETYKDYFE